MGFFSKLRKFTEKVESFTLPVGPTVPFPARPSTSELAEDLIVDSEALKMETHDPGVFDEKGDYVPQYSDDPKDLEGIGALSLSAPTGDTAPESPPADVSTPSDKKDES